MYKVLSIFESFHQIPGFEDIALVQMHWLNTFLPQINISLTAPEITQERSMVIMTTQFKIWMVRGGIWVVIKFVEQFIIFRENSSSLACNTYLTK